MSNHVRLAEEMLEKLFAASAERRIAKAQVYATLALVEQQRIANLIAMWQGSPVRNEYISEVDDALTAADGTLASEIAQALGIKNEDQSAP